MDYHQDVYERVIRAAEKRDALSLRMWISFSVFVFFVWAAGLLLLGTWLVTDGATAVGHWLAVAAKAYEQAR